MNSDCLWFIFIYFGFTSLSENKVKEDRLFETVSFLFDQEINLSSQTSNIWFIRNKLIILLINLSVSKLFLKKEKMKHFT